MIKKFRSFGFGFWVLGFGLLILTGCTQSFQQGMSNINADIQAGDVSNLSDHIKALTLSDIDAALVRATASNDVNSMQCYPVMRKYAGQGLPVIGTKSAGIVDSIQAARDGVNNLNTNLVPADLQAACGGWTQSNFQFAAKMAAILAAVGAVAPK